MRLSVTSRPAQGQREGRLASGHAVNHGRGAREAVATLQRHASGHAPPEEGAGGRGGHVCKHTTHPRAHTNTHTHTHTHTNTQTHKHTNTHTHQIQTQS